MTGAVYPVMHHHWVVAGLGDNYWVAAGLGGNYWVVAGRARALDGIFLKCHRNLRCILVRPGEELPCTSNTSRPGGVLFCIVAQQCNGGEDEPACCCVESLAQEGGGEAACEATKEFKGSQQRDACHAYRGCNGHNARVGNASMPCFRVCNLPRPAWVGRHVRYGLLSCCVGLRRCGHWCCCTGAPE
eukprot:366082-Chlamydomonas_euryale.AAC.12